MTKTYVLWVKWENGQGIWESDSIGGNDPNGWLLSERLEDIKQYITGWKIKGYQTLIMALDDAFGK